MSKTITEQNAILNAQMNVPYETRAEAEAAIKAFCDGVKALREKHRIAEVVLGAETIWTEDGKARRGIASLFFGTTMRSGAIARDLFDRQVTPILDRLFGGGEE